MSIRNDFYSNIVQQVTGLYNQCIPGSVLFAFASPYY